MPKGFDTTEDCSAKAHQIKVAGYDFVARYLSRSAWKRITAEEVETLLEADVSIVLVYEDGPTAVNYFSYARGQIDGSRAAQQANALGAPEAATIYFAIDYDASEQDLGGPISEYFRGVANSLRSFASANNPHYRIGVYGSGAACLAMAGAGLATQGWLAQATGWRGHGAYTTWSIAQGMPSTVLGLSVDPDTAIGDYGAIVPAGATS
jgi:Rv2525c-like, glycoside hydrolase-like domain